MIVHDRADITGVLVAARKAKGMTCEAFDHHVGWADRYVAKLEHPETPSGRHGFHISAMADLWLKALGLRLVLMTERQADEIGAVEIRHRPTPAPSPPVIAQPPYRVTIRRVRFSRG